MGIVIYIIKHCESDVVWDLSIVTPLKVEDVFNTYLNCDSSATGASCESGISAGLTRLPRTTTTL